jgi:CubicO group peptidase (beta-lactamase class C family)
VTVNGQPLTAAGLTQLHTFLDDWLDYRASQRLFPGFSIAISVEDDIIYEQGFGLADIPTQRYMTSTDAMCVGSQSKILTATAILQLVASGDLSLHDEASRYLPWLRAHTDTAFSFITIEQLLRHTAGLVRDGNQVDFWLIQRPFPDANALKQLVLKSSLIEPSGAATKYSNLGYALLGQIIETASGKSYGQFVEKHIIRPLNLQHTWVNGSKVTNAHPIATGYSGHFRGQRLPLPPAIPVYTYAPVTGWYSTPGDMTRLLQALVSDASPLIADASLRALLWESQHSHWQPAQASRGAYGLGLIRGRVEGRDIVGHSGGFMAFQSCTYIDPINQMCVSVAANAADAPVNEIAMGVFSVFDHFTRHSAVETTAELQQFQGVFENIFGVRAFVPLGTSVVAVPLNDWDPFETAEILTIVDDHTLRIADASFLAARGELVRFEYKNGAAIQITYAGMPLQPHMRFAKR